MILLIGPSGSGKTTLLNMLCENGFTKVKSCTTRAPRNESEYDDYDFFTKDNFQALVDSGAFAEHEEYDGNFYGTLAKDVGKWNAIKIVEPKGFKKLVEKFPNIMSVYVDTDEDIRQERMLSRGDNEANVQRRIELDKKVFEQEIKFSTDIVFYNNDDLSKDRLKSLVEILCLEQMGGKWGE